MQHLMSSEVDSKSLCHILYQYHYLGTASLRDEMQSDILECNPCDAVCRKQHGSEVAVEAGYQRTDAPLLGCLAGKKWGRLLRI